MDGPQAPPGWYEDPEDAAYQREWDGSGWTGARRPVGGSGEPASPPPGWYPDPETPDTERWWDGAVWTDARRAMVPDTRPWYRSPWVLLLLALVAIALAVWLLTRDDSEQAGGASTTATGVDTTVPAESSTSVPEPTTTTVAGTTTVAPETTTTAGDTTTTAPETTTTVEAVREPVFGDGEFVVGRDIQPGVYETGELDSGFFGGTCTWARLSDTSGSTDAVIVQREARGHEVVQIEDTDAAFVSEDCDEWFEIEALDQPLEPIPEGTWVVGVHIEPGTYLSDGGSDCSWERLADASRDPDSIIESQQPTDSTSVEIDEDDFAFGSTGCGEWTAG